MKLTKMLSDVTRYLSDAISRIFSPSRDDYPPTGVQPYTGDPYDEHSSNKR